jgi:hypothetical protein
MELVAVATIAGALLLIVLAIALPLVITASVVVGISGYRGSAKRRTSRRGAEDEAHLRRSRSTDVPERGALASATEGAAAASLPDYELVPIQALRRT